MKVLVKHLKGGDKFTRDSSDRPVLTVVSNRKSIWERFNVIELDDGSSMDMLSEETVYKWSEHKKIWEVDIYDCMPGDIIYHLPSGGNQTLAGDSYPFSNLDNYRIYTNSLKGRTPIKQVGCELCGLELNKNKECPSGHRTNSSKQ